MDRETALARLKECAESLDAELAHGTADEVLCDLLRSLGYDDVVDVWETVDKWYA